MLVLALFGLAVLAGGALFWLGTRVGGRPRHTWTGFSPFGFLLFVLIVAGVVALVRGARRTAGPIDEVMAAAGRVAAGDYSARVAARGPREVRQLGRSFNAMAERLEANEKTRRQLFADVAHELRTPLTIIQANVEGILDGLYPADRAHLEPALEETNVMARLLEDLSTLAMAESRALRLHTEPVDPADLVADAVAAHRLEAEAAGVHLLAEPPGSDLPQVVLDPVRIREVLSNLLANALRYTPSGGRITASAGAAADRPGSVTFRVADTGSGIAADRLEHVFDRFSKSPDSRGAGLGLAIAKSLVEAHGGSIHAVSDANGTTFTFVVPLAGRPEG
jgi:signal transduction histidine kinase